ncbi:MULTISPECIES: META domain-containing protein [Methanoculleus]|jgi:heat shock protein HslJ|uniref:DUF306 domain-containing protein n=3 Tax=Methanomicrobiaceae TaxID=2194 RepID=A3CRS0_METMJ|nr:MULTISPECIES: META domain-containing protein [Methanoculleus]NMA88947.1 META domain-containing protein [Methanoculleus bourgensis]NQS74489.1 META domain-containing protein [Methanoculleus sp.]ABN56070.1 protein of unknown function DUF306, Meta and HslJ [Methanoculleus marisnigri JR1]UYU17548.1 META domain-containing protein [Methanoculleus submarinus]SAI86956.1 hypothetical protein MBBA_0068 [Methanoculleus bourgensis]
MRKNSRRAVRVALAGLLVFVVCLGVLVFTHSAGARDDTRLPPDGNPSLLANDNQSPLSGRSWHLTSYWTEEGEVPVIEKTDPIIAFTDAGRVSGTSGCNIFFGGHDLSGSTLRIHDIESTKMTSTPEVLDQEKVFFTLLQKTRAYTIDGDCLRLFDASGREILSFTSQTQPLQGKAWYLWSPRNDTGGAVQDPGTDQISLQFLGESQFRGTAAGTDYCGTYEASGDTIRFGPAEGWVELPEWYSSLLKQAHGYRIIGAQLDIMNENGHSIMSFTRMPPSLVSVDWYLQQHRAADGPGLLTPEGTYDLILFMPDGMITGIIHGIQLFAQYDADDSSISFGPVAMLIAEDDDPGKASESREMIESMFGEARTYWVWNGTLELSSGDGKPLVTMANTPAL